MRYGLIALMLVAPTQAQDAEAAAAELYKEGVNLWLGNKRAEAVTVLREVVEKYAQTQFMKARPGGKGTRIETAVGFIAEFEAGRQDKLDPVIDRLSSSDFAAQALAARSLALRGPAAVAALNKASDDKKEWVTRILAKIDETAKVARPLVEKLGSADDEEKEAAESKLRALSEWAAAYLEETKASANKNLRQRAGKLLASIPAASEYHSIGDDAPVDALVKALSHDDWRVQGEAARALLAAGDAVLPAIRKAAEGNENVRFWAGRIAARIEEGGKRFKAMIEGLASDDDDVKEKAEAALKGAGAAAIPHLEEAVANGGKNLKKRAEALLVILKKPVGGRFGTRFGGKLNLVARGGGNRATESAVLAALKWLARHQGEDGSWSAGGFGANCVSRGDCDGPGEGEHTAGVTALALLAFLGAGYTPLSKDEYPDPAKAERQLKFGDVTSKAIAWLVKQQDKEGCVGARASKYMYSHAIATMALCEAYGMTEDPALKKPAQTAVDFLVGAQNKGKGWRYAAKSGDNDTSVTSWCVAALRAAELADLSFPRKAYEGALAWYDEVTGEEYWIAGYTHKGTGKVFVPGRNEKFEHHATMTAAAMAGRIVINRNRKELALGAGDVLLNDLPDSRELKSDAYYWFWGTMAIYQVSGPDGPGWKRWNEPLKNAIVPTQFTGKDGCKNGSWDPAADRWGFEGGRVALTALNALTLETYYRYALIFGEKK